MRATLFPGISLCGNGTLPFQDVAKEPEGTLLEMEEASLLSREVQFRSGSFGGHQLRAVI